jgi:superfamily I DNA/RNA helicase
MDIKIIFGPPGTGKTTTLLNILEKELKNYSSEQIAYVSFTKEGANQGKERAAEKFNLVKSNMPYFRTLHSIAFREAGLKRSEVINKKNYKYFSDKMGMHFTGYYTEELKHNDDQYLFFNILHRNNPKTAYKYIDGMDVHTIKHIAHNYKRFKKTFGIYDYTDMIELFNDKNTSLPVKVAIIDEAQDLTTLQWEMIWIAFRDCERIYIAGDDDQAIYQWSGADVEYFLKLNGNIEILKKSYRLPIDILNFSLRISRLIQNRVVKDYKGTPKKGVVEHIKSLDEVNFNDGSTWMILSRNRYFLNEIEQKIRNKGLIYTKFKEKSIKKEEIDAINLFEKVRKTMSMTELEELKLKKHVDEMNLYHYWYDNFNWPIDKIMYYRDIIQNKTNLNECRIKIETIHSVKGDEADNVILLTDISKQVSLNLQNNPDSEHRVFYVGATRAKQNLFILHGSSQYQYKFY